MARKKKSADLPAQTYTHTKATRKNNPPARLAAEGHVKPMPRAEYGYSPRLPPQLRFDATGKADRQAHRQAAQRGQASRHGRRPPTVGLAKESTTDEHG